MRKESRLPDDWFEKARKDLRRVEVLLADDDVEGAGFHLQQAEERYPFMGSPPPARHELEEALDAIREMVALIFEETD